MNAEGFFMRFIYFLLLFSAAVTSQAQFLINEVSYTCAGDDPDPDKHHPEWIELCNRTRKNIELHHYRLIRFRDGKKRTYNLPSGHLAKDECMLIYAEEPLNNFAGHHYETLIAQGEDWKYLEFNDIPAYPWYAVEWDDKDWLIGCSGFGYGDEDDCTPIFSKRGVIIRKKLTLKKNKFSRYLMAMDYDDAFVLYINGHEAARSNIGISGFPLEDKDFPYQQHPVLLSANSSAELYKFPDSLFIEGENSIAIMGLNISETSSDLSLIPILLGMSNSDAITHPAPDWFSDPDPYLKTGFGLMHGDSLVLIKEDNRAVHHLVVPPLRLHQSFGINARFEKGYFATGSPGLANGDDFSLTPVSSPLLLISSGIFQQPLTIFPPDSLSGLVCRYTTDGREPTTKDKKLDRPLAINKTAVLRLAYFTEQGIISGISNYTYIIKEKNVLPILSLIVDPEHLFSPEKGIYSDGAVADTIYPYYGSNYWQPWEYPASLQVIAQRGGIKYETIAGLSIHGGGSRTKPMKSLRLSARKEYGNSYLEFPFFGSDDTVRRFKRIILKNGGQNFDGSYITDELVHRLAAKAGMKCTQKYQPYNVYINGLYWGIHNGREKYGRQYLNENFGYAEKNIDLIGGGGSIIYDGNNRDFLLLRNYILENDMRQASVYDSVADRLDINEFIDYFIFNIYTKNMDWDRLNNVKIWRSAEQRKWYYLLVDLDLSMGELASTHPDFLQWVMQDEYIHFRLFRSLWENEDFKYNFTQRLRFLLQTVLSSDNVVHEIDALQALLANDMPRHLKRWKQPIGQWEDAVEKLRKFARERPASLAKEWEQVMGEPLFP